VTFITLLVCDFDKFIIYVGSAASDLLYSYKVCFLQLMGSHAIFTATRMKLEINELLKSSMRNHLISGPRSKWGT